MKKTIALLLISLLVVSFAAGCGKSEPAKPAAPAQPAKAEPIIIAYTPWNGYGALFVAAQKGMFSTLPLNQDQIIVLREQHGIYMTDAARINVAGLRHADIPRFVEALRAVA